MYSSEASCHKGIESVKGNAPIAHLQMPGEEAVNPRFMVYHDKADKPRFYLTAKNGQKIAASQAYHSMESCLNGVESVRKNAPDAEVTEAE